MGRIFEGFEPGLGSHAAIKVLREEFLDDAPVRARFDEEARIIASITHPGCLPVYGWGIDGDGRPFYAMKKISGKTLTELFEERGEAVTSLVWRRRLLHIFQSICETIAYAHEQGIVHRDLKPDNVMIDPFGSIYVIDWGLAKRLGEKTGRTTASRTLAGAVMGSPGYMAPEQADGKTVDAGPEADVFALGVILYEILTGVAPFAGSTERESMAHAINFEPKPPHRTRLLLSRSLSSVCMKCLEKDPRKRYRTASRLAEDITAFNEGRAVSTARPSLLERAMFWTHREPVRAAATWAVGLAVLTAVLVIGLQVVIDRRLADKTMDHLAGIDRELGELYGEADALRGQLAAKGPKHGELSRALRQTEGRILLRQIQGLNAIRSVKELRFLRADPELDTRYQMRLFELLETGADGPNSSLLHALTSTLLEEAERNGAPVNLGSADVQRLRSIHERTGRAGHLQQ